MIARRAVLGKVVTEVSAAWFPINEKLDFPGAVLDPIEAHIDGFEYFLFYCAVCETLQCRVVDTDWSRWLRVP